VDEPSRLAREMAKYWALSQIGAEMIVPIVLGWWLDDRWGTAPWLVIVGGVLGFGGGLLHLMVQLRQLNNDGGK
jgi:F0F1-type ATP synthase assembly protein I